MLQFLKWAGVLFSIMLVGIVLAMVLLVTLVDPNRLKPILVEQVMRYTGRQLTIAGDLSWTFFPYLGVKIGHLSLSNPTTLDDKTFAEISQLTLGVKFIPLLQRKIESSGIVLDGLKLHLTKTKTGQVNWTFPTAAQTAKPNKASSTKKIASMGLAISGLAVHAAAVDYSDEQTHKAYAIKQFNLQAKEINFSAPFAVKSSFDFTANAPLASGHVVLAGDVNLNLPAQIYHLDNLYFTANITQEHKNISLKLLGNIKTDLQQQILQWSDLNGQVANITLAGNIKVTGLTTHPITTGHIHLQPFDLKETLRILGQPVADLQVAKQAQGDADFTADARGVIVQSHFTLDTLQAAKLTMTAINAKAHWQNGRLNLAPLSAKLYQGTLTGQTLVDLRSAIPQMTLQAQLTNIQAQPLIDDLTDKAQKIKITGIGNFTTQLTTSGITTKALLQNLNGVSQFNFNQGALVGIDLDYIIDTAYAIVKRQIPIAINRGQTPFGRLTGTAVIHHGVINNRDLFADTPYLVVHGAGTIDLVNQQLDYSLPTTLKPQAGQKEAWLSLYGVTLPILLKGNLANPTIRLDPAAFAKVIAQQQVQQMTQQAQEKIQEQLTNKAGELLQHFLGN